MSELCIFVLPFRVKLEPLIQKPLSLTTGHTAGSDKNLMHYYMKEILYKIIHQLAVLYKNKTKLQNIINFTSNYNFELSFTTETIALSTNRNFWQKI